MKLRQAELNAHTSSRVSKKEIVRSLLICAVLLVGGFLAGVVSERRASPSGEGMFANLEAVHSVIEDNYYYYPTSAEEQAAVDGDMESGAIDGALLTLGDSYTRYLDVDESQTAQEGMEGKYGGVGIEVIMDGDVAFVSSVVPESPADDVGIIRGDVIEQINGARVQTTDANDVLRMLRGDIGTEIGITLVRPSTGEVLDHTLTLEEIVIPPVTLVFIEGTNYAWLRITLFGDTTVADLDAAIAEIRARGSTGIILDLRGNGGGWVEAAQHTLGRFIDPSTGPAMFEDRSAGEGGMTEMPIQTGDGTVPLDLPMVVLIDGGTASASEIVAGAMKDYNRAILVGEKSFGKGSVQRIYEFSDGSTMRVTVAEWFTPSRARIQSEGIRPDVEIAASSDAAGDDAILQAGIDVLDTQLAPPASTPTSIGPASPVPTN